MSSENTSPLTFDLQQDLLDNLKRVQKKVGARSLSELVRYAVSVFDSSNVDLKSTAHRQISVRLSSDLRRRLVRISKQKKVSVGELLRAALESLPTELSDFNLKQTMPKKKTTKKKVAKKVAKKAPVKKAAAKKAPIKKVAAKEVPKKTAPKGPLQGPKTAAESVKGKPLQGPSNYKGSFFKNKESALNESKSKFMNSKGRGKAKSKSGESARQAGYRAGRASVGGKAAKKVKKGAGKVLKSRITQGVGAGYAGAKMGSRGNGGSSNPQSSKYFTEAELQAAKARVKANRNR